jgi:hypothetical protein
MTLARRLQKVHLYGLINLFTLRAHFKKTGREDVKLESRDWSFLHGNI